MCNESDEGTPHALKFVRDVTRTRRFIIVIHLDRYARAHARKWSSTSLVLVRNKYEVLYKRVPTSSSSRRASVQFSEKFHKFATLWSDRKKRSVSHHHFWQINRSTLCCLWHLVQIQICVLFFWCFWFLNQPKLSADKITKNEGGLEFLGRFLLS